MHDAETGQLYAIDVRVSLRPAVLDAQGSAILRGLRAMGYGTIDEVHAGKCFRLRLRAASPDEAVETARGACERLLSNPVIETFTVRLAEHDTA